MSRFRRRVDDLRSLFSSVEIEALVVSKLENVRYLSGFTGSAGSLRVTESEAGLVTDSRYAEQAAAESPDFEIDVTSGAPAVIAATRAAVRRIGFEAGAICYDVWEGLRGVVQDKAGGVLVPCRGLVERLRARKDPSELALIKQAVDIASQAFERTLPMVRPGVSEKDLALEIEFRMKMAGAEAVAFDLIVASGPRSSLPHGRASGRKLAAGEFVVFDIGARFEGYHSDMTRTIYTGEPGVKECELYETVLGAQRAAIRAVVPGATAGSVDEAARSVIREKGFGDHFGHGTGHGVGLEVHEAPRVGTSSTERLEPGMVLTIEPGIYLAGEGGVRIEDMIVVEQNTHQVLTSLDKTSWALE
ncbi:MAG: M24 family metallopeptidase [Acidobacteriota bacterium]